MVIKNAHTRSPKKFFEEHMADMPGGTWIVMEGHATRENVDLILIGYKYNKRKVMTFVTTKGAGKISFYYFREMLFSSRTANIQKYNGRLDYT